MTPELRGKIAAFWSLCTTSELYGLGYSDAAAASGATRPTDDAESFRAWAYLKGYSDACRLACPFMGAAWQVAHVIGIASGTLLACLDNAEPTPDAKVVRMLLSYGHELRELRDKLESAAA